MGFIIRGFIWDIPILVFAYVLFWGPIIDSRDLPRVPFKGCTMGSIKGSIRDLEGLEVTWRPF